MRSKCVLCTVHIFVCLLIVIPVMAQTESSLTGTAIRLSCAADGSSTQALAQNFRRRSVTLQNKSGKQVRIAFLATGTADLTTSNSFVLEASSNYIDSAPGVYTGRIVCMSTDASTADIDVTETQR